MKSFQTFGDLVLVAILALVAFVVGLLPGLNTTILRVVTGTIVVLFVPGYAFIAALFPRKMSLNNGVRLGLSFGASIAIVPLLAMALNYTRWGIRFVPTLLIITLFTLACVTGAGIRRRRLPEDERFTVDWQAQKRLERQRAALLSGSSLDRTLSIILLLAIGASVAVGSYVILVPKPSEHFTEFYLLGANDTFSNYTTQFRVGVPSPVKVVVVNHEARNVTYDLVIYANNSTQREVVYSEKVVVPDGQQWEKQIDLVLNQPGDSVKLEYALYEDHVTANPYRDVHVWVNVSS
jgi:uncharacterized membrane protein